MWVYAFFNLETRAVYTKMFKLVFKVLGNTARLFIQFVYIYRIGLYIVIVNIYKKQASNKYTLSIHLAYAYNI